MTFTIAHWVVRITGVLQLILGLLFWTGDALNLIQVHELLGTLLVLALWLLAATASQMGAPLGMAIGAAVLGLLVLLVGFGQLNWLALSYFWGIQIVHLLLGVGAVASGEMIAGRLRRARLSASSV